MTSTNGFPRAGAPNESVAPVVRNIFDFSAEALGQLKTWLEQNNLAVPISQVVGFSQTQASVKVTNSANQSIADSTFTTLTFDTEVFDQPDNTMHDTGSNTSRLTCRVAGVYQPYAYVAFAANATGQRAWRLLQNGSAVGDTAVQINTTTGALNAEYAQTWPPIKLAIGDYLELNVWQNSGGALNILSATTFGMVRVN